MGQSILASVNKKERVDESFFFDKKAELHLTFTFDQTFFRAVVFNSDRNKFVLQAEFESDDIPMAMKEIFEKTDFLQKEFASIRYISQSLLSTLIPEVLFDRNKEEEYLRFNHALSAEHLVYVNSIQANQSRLIFAIPSTEAAFVRTRFAHAKITHSAVPLIEALVLMNKNVEGKKMYIQVGQNHIEIVVISNGTLILYNQFEYRSPEDFVYYPLFIAEQLQLNPEQIEIFLMGNISKNSEYYEMIYKYFRNVLLVPRNDRFEYAYKLEETDAFRYFQLFASELCV